MPGQSSLKQHKKNTQELSQQFLIHSNKYEHHTMCTPASNHLPSSHSSLRFLSIHMLPRTITAHVYIGLSNLGCPCKMDEKRGTGQPLCDGTCRTLLSKSEPVARSDRIPIVARSSRIPINSFSNFVSCLIDRDMNH